MNRTTATGNSNTTRKCVWLLDDGTYAVEARAEACKIVAADGDTLCRICGERIPLADETFICDPCMTACTA